MSRRHALVRTSPKGSPFLGTCTQCGKTGLPSRAVGQACINPANLSESDAVVLAIEGLDALA
jgi:hypothetical protein